MIELPMAQPPNPLGEKLDQADREVADHLVGNTSESVKKAWERHKASEKRREEKRKAEQEYQRASAIRWAWLQQVLVRNNLDQKKVPTLALQLMFYTDFSEWMNDQANEKDVLAGAIIMAEDMAKAALANECIQELIAEGNETEERIRSNPPLRVEFEQAYVIAGLSDAMFATQNKKSWGPCIGVNPINPDDYIHPYRVGIVYRENCKYNQRFEQRKWMKKALGRGYRTLVTKAKGMTKAKFLAAIADNSLGLKDPAAKVKEKLGLDMGTFWRAAKGALMVEKPVEKPAVKVVLDQRWLPFGSGIDLEGVQ